MSDEKPVLSIIVPLYNEDPEVFRLCCTSIRVSTFTSYEVIVVDDCFFFGYESIAREFGFHYIALTENSGAGAARNAGVAASRGKIFCFLDSDIELMPDTLGKIVAHFDENPSLAALTTLCSTTNRFKNFASQYKTAFTRWGAADMKSEVAYIWTACAAIKRTAFETAGGFTKTYQGASWEDTEIALTIIENGGKIRFYGDIEVNHHKRVSATRLVTSDFRRTSELIDLILRLKGPLAGAAQRSLPVSNLDTGAAIAMVSLNLFALYLFIVALTPLDLGVTIPCVLSLGYLFGSMRFIRYCHRQGGVLFAGKAIFVNLSLNLLYGAGTIHGLLRFFRRKRTP